jgi:RNA polymerase sigma factor (sigma-70 family)
MLQKKIFFFAATFPSSILSNRAMENEQELVRRIISGERQGFRLLIERYQRLVLHMAGRIIRNDTELEDLCQDIFIKIYQELPKFRFQSKLSTWIATVAYRTAINYAKKKKIPVSDLAENALEHHQTAITPESLYSQKTLKELIHKHVDKLPVHYRTVLTLYHLEDMNYKEIGEITQMPEGTVKNYLFRARKLLKEQLQTYLPQEEMII